MGKSLHTMYAFYIYSHQDAPERTMGQPFVKFHSLVSHSAAGSVKADTDLTEYQGVQLSILPYKDFWVLINPGKFCSTQDDAQKGLADRQDQLLVNKPAGSSYSDVNMYMHTVRFPKESNTHPKDVQVSVRATGVYILVFSNCGDFVQATVSGSVVVKNAYGFLPGNE